MTQTSNRFFDEIAKLMNDAAGVAQGVRREFDVLFRTQAVETFDRGMAVRSLFPFALCAPLELRRLRRLAERLARVNQRGSIYAVINGSFSFGHGDPPYC